MTRGPSSTHRNGNAMADGPHNPLHLMLDRLGSRRPFGDEDRAAILNLPYTRQSLGAHAYVVREGDKPTHCCLLLDGFLYRHKVVGDGGRQICAIHIKGDLADLQNSLLEEADHSLQALTPCDIAVIPREAIRKLAFERPAVGEAMWRETLIDASISREWITNIGRRPARRRLAHLLCEYAVRLEAAGLAEREKYTLEMTQEQLADCTGLTPVHVNRTLREMDSEGLLTRSSRSVAVNDWSKLVAVGDFRPDYLHLPKDQMDRYQRGAGQSRGPLGFG